MESKNTLLKTFILFISFAVFLASLFLKNDGVYRFVPLIPLAFFICSLIFRSLYDEIPHNFGLTVLILLMFFRAVIYILIYEIGGHYSRISGVDDSIELASLLMIYENFVVFLVLWLCNKKKHKYINKTEPSIVYYDERKMNVIILVLVIAFIFTILFVPECLKMYKTLLQIKDKEFTSYDTEVSTIVNTYGTTFFKKLVLVIHTYLMKLLRFLIPLQLIVLIYKKDAKKSKYYLCCLISLCALLVLDGSIARSLIYAFALLYVSAMIYNKKKSLYRIVIITGCAVFAYFVLRLSISNNKLSTTEYMSGLFGAYFSGVENTAAVVRLQSTFSEKLLYFGCDYFQSIPFGNTIFGVSNVSFQNFYNEFNGSHGQIVTTIGLGYYYFGFFFAPLYSALFSFLSYRFGLKAAISKDTLMCGIYSFAALISAMAIVMYYVQISLASLLGPVLQLLIIAYFVKYKKVQIKRDLNESIAN